MDIAILFWFYEHPDVSRNRLNHLRALNPGTPIYGLYGGALDRAAKVAHGLESQLDDLWCYRGPEDGAWKWWHGEQLIAAWYRERGRFLPWDTVLVAQWDLLLLAPIGVLLARLKPGEALFSGLRPAHETREWWGWLRGQDPDKRREEVAFLDYLKAIGAHDAEIWCCLFIVAALPRDFLERFVAEGAPVAGFLEYKLPTLARLYGIPFCTEHPFAPWWAADPATQDAPPERRILNAAGHEVPRPVVEAESRSGRAYAFHPFRGLYDLP